MFAHYACMHHPPHLLDGWIRFSFRRSSFLCKFRNSAVQAASVYDFHLDGLHFFGNRRQFKRFSSINSLQGVNWFFNNMIISMHNKCNQKGRKKFTVTWNETRGLINMSLILFINLSFHQRTDIHWYNRKLTLVIVGVFLAVHELYFLVYLSLFFKMLYLFYLLIFCVFFLI